MLEILVRNPDGEKTPEVIFSPKGSLSMKGRLAAPDYFEFFKDLRAWAHEYIKASALETNVVMDIEFGESVIILSIAELFNILKPVTPKIKWYVDDDDEDMIEKIEGVRHNTGHMKIEVIERSSGSQSSTGNQFCEPFSQEGTKNAPAIEVTYPNEKNMTICTIKGIMHYDYDHFAKFKEWLEKYKECPKGRTIVFIHLDSTGPDGLKDLKDDALVEVKKISNAQIMWVYEDDNEEMSDAIDKISQEIGTTIIKKTLSVERIVEKLTDEKMQRFIAEC